MRPDPRRPPTVLVVADDPITREVLETMLRNGGFGVLSVSSGEGALLLLCQLRERIDWLVTRVSLPGLVDAWLLADEYHQHQARRPVILLSEAIPEAECPSVDAVFVPPTAAWRVVEVLKGLCCSEPAQVLPFKMPQAA
ncbi:CheY-like chemotaxis protein [Microvirga subterranea]|uniref:CheY-like chemotaxis protein n=1 Tax=Microvirga subterranea TaxID=186651 RepID=A0A370H341_9HYPH|nr:response regulator [Microvirga subterranea]RDI50385.1 CheY-like chemotaxis protein [Microvirga subterranea]